LVRFGIDPSTDTDALRAAEGYVHYIHGLNPLSLVYLSNMGDHGAAKSVTTFYHTWFAHGSALWDAVGTSTYGPPPGYLVGGANPSYNWDGCCPSNCSGLSCGSAVLSPPAGQPPQKSYFDFNDSWPLDSWSVTEPSLGYQTNYIRLLAHFAR
jgi:endoglucanase